MLTLSKSQYKDMCHDCASQMMQGNGEGLPDTIPDFTGTNVQFYVSDPALEGGGFMDTNIVQHLGQEHTRVCPRAS